MPIDLGLTGKVAIVTGASQGIGAAIARALAGQGMRVVVSSRKPAAVEKVAAEITEGGGQATSIAAHVGEPRDLEKLVAETVLVYGGIDVVVNNAATNPAFGEVLKENAAIFDKIMHVNVRGPLLLSQLAYPHLVARGGGSIINVSSISGVRPEDGLGIYGVSKAALNHLTRTLAREWGPVGIRVNALALGLVQTKFSAALWQDEASLARFVKQTPLGRIAQPQDVVGAALWLASPLAAYCTGTILAVDGGYLA